MSSHARSSREEGRSLSLRTLVFASVGSAVAAIFTSHLWTAGTPIAAAATPVIVALVSELLHRPTERIAQRLTTEAPSPRETDALPEAAGAGPPPRAEEHRPEPAREMPPAAPRRRPPPRGGPARGAGSEPEFRVYRTGPSASGLPWRAILVTAAAAFAIAAAALTLPELVTGSSLFGNDRDTTIFGGGKRGDSGNRPTTEQETAPQETQPADPEQEEPQPTVPAPEPAPEQITPTTPPTTTPPPAQPRSPAPTAPPPAQP